MTDGNRLHELREIFLTAPESDATRIVAIAGSVSLIITVLWLVRTRRLREEYTPIWIAVAAILLLLCVRFDILRAITHAIGAWTPSSTIFFLGEVFLIVICLNYAVRLSRVSIQFKNLAQEVALLRGRLDRMARSGAGNPGKTGLFSLEPARPETPDGQFHLPAKGTPRGGTCVLARCGSATIPRYRLPTYDIVRCTRCHMMYRHPFPTASELSEMYDDPAYHESTYFSAQHLGETALSGPEVPIYRGGLRWLEERIGGLGNGRGTLLDVGCGTGFFLWLAREEGWTVEGVELSELHAQGARQRFGLTVQCGDFLQVSLAREQYDVVTMWDFLEHVSDPEAVLDRARTLLSPGGYLVVFTINCASLFNRLGDVLYRVSRANLTRPVSLLYDARHNYYFTVSTLTALLERSGFTIEGRQSHRAHLNRWLSEPAPWWITAGGNVVDLLSVPPSLRYRQLVFCRRAN